MTLLEIGRTASKYDTDIAHAMLLAVAIAFYRGSAYGYLPAPSIDEEAT